MDEQEFFNKIKELQKQRDLLKKDVTVLECKINELTDVLRYFRDNGELKKAYEIQKDSLTNMANSPWAKLVIGMFTSKVQEDKVDVELPDIDALIKENTSDEFIERKINDILGIKEK